MFILICNVGGSVATVATHCGSVATHLKVLLEHVFLTLAPVHGRGYVDAMGGLRALVNGGC